MGHEIPPEDGTPAVDFQEVQASPEFQDLRRKHRSFVFPLAAFFLLWYFAYVLLADYAHEFMSTKLWGNINVGLVFGLLQFVTTFGITAWYVRYSNKTLDPIATGIREGIERHEHDRSAATPGEGAAR